MIEVNQIVKVASVGKTRSYLQVCWQCCSVAFHPILSYNLMHCFNSVNLSFSLKMCRNQSLWHSHWCIVFCQEFIVRFYHLCHCCVDPFQFFHDKALSCSHLIFKLNISQSLESNNFLIFTRSLCHCATLLESTRTPGNSILKIQSC